MKKLSLFLLPFLLGALVLLRFYDGTLIYYVASRYLWLVAGGGAFLCVLGIFGSRFPHALSHVYSQVKSWQIFFLFLPIFLGFIITPTPLSANTALQRGLGQNLPTYLSPAPFSFAVDSSQRNFGDWARLLFSSAQKSTFINQKATISGFISIDEDKIFLTRFQVSCCAADGRPVGIRINPINTKNVAHNSWWSVSGTMQTAPDGEIWLQAEEMTEIEIPVNPYL